MLRIAISHNNHRFFQRPADGQQRSLPRHGPMTEKLSELLHRILRRSSLGNASKITTGFVTSALIKKIERDVMACCSSAAAPFGLFHNTNDQYAPLAIGKDIAAGQRRGTGGSASSSPLRAVNMKLSCQRWVCVSSDDRGV
jgi:hypothetical protein